MARALLTEAMSNLKVIVFEGRSKCFFVPCSAGSADFDSCWRQKLELHKVEVLKIHNAWTVRLLWKKNKEIGEGCSIVKTFFVMVALLLHVLLYFYSLQNIIKDNLNDEHKELYLGLKHKKLGKKNYNPKEIC
jgi:hypothetical protein